MESLQSNPDQTKLALIDRPVFVFGPLCLCVSLFDGTVSVRSLTPPPIVPNRKDRLELLFGRSQLVPAAGSDATREYIAAQQRASEFVLAANLTSLFAICCIAVRLL